MWLQGKTEIALLAKQQTLRVEEEKNSQKNGCRQRREMRGNERDCRLLKCSSLIPGKKSERKTKSSHKTALSPNGREQDSLNGNESGERKRKRYWLEEKDEGHQGGEDESRLES